MVPTSPASHDHYFCVNLILVLGLVAAVVRGEGRRLGGRGLALLLIGYVASCTLPMVPELRVLRDVRLPLLGSLALWLAGALVLCGQRRGAVENTPFVLAAGYTSRALHFVRSRRRRLVQLID
jgi:hypothetical protein